VKIGGMVKIEVLAMPRWKKEMKPVGNKMPEFSLPFCNVQFVISEILNKWRYINKNDSGEQRF
jgi:hypothetical protein